MKALFRILLLCTSVVAYAQEFAPEPMELDPLSLEVKVPVPVSSVPVSAEAEEDCAEEVPEEEVLDVPRDQTRVTVLGYHNFSKKAPVTEMLMRTSEFREQMAYLRRAGITVISMQEFLEWRLGTRTLPARCAMITLDDGWKSVYTDAYPILKEFGYPFTLFLYTNFLHGRGDSLSGRSNRLLLLGGLLGRRRRRDLVLRLRILLLAAATILGCRLDLLFYLLLSLNLVAFLLRLKRLKDFHAVVMGEGDEVKAVFAGADIAVAKRISKHLGLFYLFVVFHFYHFLW